MHKSPITGYGDNLTVFGTRIGDLSPKDHEKIDLSVTVEIVTGEVVDIIYQIFPIEKFGDAPWVSDYKKKADHFEQYMKENFPEARVHNEEYENKR